jgi:hypothetical protein
METVNYVVAGLDGQIIRAGTCPRSMIAAQAGIGEQAVEGAADPILQYVFDGVVRDFTPAQSIRRLHKPGAWAVWRMEDMDWYDPRPAADQLRAAKSELWFAIKAARRAAIDAVISTPFGYFDADPDSRAAISEALAFRALDSTSATQPITWTTADNQAITLTVEQFGELARLLADRTQACHDQARRLRAAIEAASTPQDLTAINWPQAP